MSEFDDQSVDAEVEFCGAFAQAWGLDLDVVQRAIRDVDASMARRLDRRDRLFAQQVGSVPQRRRGGSRVRY